MDHFNYRDGILHVEDVPLSAIAEQHGTPCYVYSRATLERHWHAFDAALGDCPHLVCYAVKANSNIAILNLLARLGSGFDIVSVGELERVLAAGGDPSRVVFSGVGKREDELARALDTGIRCFNVEVAEELDRLDRLAGERGVKAPVSLRVNPDVDAGTHPYISTGLRENKFGIEVEEALVQYRRAARMPNLEVVGIDCHIGSQLTSSMPFIDALDRVLALVARLRGEGIAIRHLDLGGGLGIRYRDEDPPHPTEYAEQLFRRLGRHDFEILIEPGRAVAGNAGILLTRLEYLKANQTKHFAIVDAAMNDLLRPALYGAWQEIVPVAPRNDVESHSYDVVGPVCETGDFLGKSRELRLVPGDLLAVRSAGAYGFSMSSNYNSRPRPAEILVDGSAVHLIRERENVARLFAGERLLP
ncbi:diaminopimelate decarboxylase [Methylococcus capsulatus]|uniref:diaminopimelate decarboxylase n=1 Tax=Methylococcus capsulatus TaxID=414 RepID=UPI001C529E96|nr:diaminopimelate decarboxylase [Methylococcus capsulatus]QXP88369.1 diaminopimelate decarboxylase [Methylococcus capsulatus]